MMDFEGVMWAATINVFPGVCLCIDFRIYFFQIGTLIFTSVCVCVYVSVRVYVCVSVSSSSRMVITRLRPSFSSSSWF